MNAKQLERDLSFFGGFGLSEMDQRSRRLRESGLLPNSGRGRGAPDLTPQHAANIIIGLGASDRADLAGAAVILYSALKPSTGESFGFAGCQTAGEMVTSLLEDHEDRYDIYSLTFCRSWPKITVTLSKSRVFEFGYNTSENAAKAGFKTLAIRQEVIFEGPVIAQIASDLHPPPEDELGGFTGGGGMTRKLEEIRAARENTKKG